MKRILPLILSLLLVFSSAPSAGASGLVGSITATMLDGGKPVPGGNLTLYKVAEYDAIHGYRLTETYASSGIALEDYGNDTASALANFIFENSIIGTEKTVDKHGVVVFENLDGALYLLVQWQAAEGYRHLVPFLVSIPNNEGGQLVYDVSCAPKQDPVPEPTPSPTPTPGPSPTPSPTPQPTPKPSNPPGPHLPQTGQNHWFVPALSAAGLVCIILGAIFMSLERKRK